MFTVLKPVSVPIEKANPKRLMILVIWTFIGGSVGIGLVFGKGYLKELKEKWSE